MATRILRILLAGALALIAMGSFAAEITLFEHRGFEGRRVTLRGPVTSFADINFNDATSSVIVRSGVWELCTEAIYRGRCARFGPGEYNSLDEAFNDRVSSAREMGADGDYVGGGGEVRVVLFDYEGFGGNSVTLTSAIDNFERIGFNDRAESAIVYGGVWRLCEHEQLRGDCRDFGPGRYDNLGGLGHRVSSAAVVGGGYVPPPRPAIRAEPVRAVLYEYPNFGGRSFPIERDVVRNLDRVGFNDRAASIRIEAGYWLFCTDSNFEGECRTFGPGDYPRLPWDIDRKISSGRMISSHYPYNAPPVWTR